MTIIRGVFIVGCIMMLAFPVHSQYADILVRFVDLPNDEGFVKAGLIKDPLTYLSKDPTRQPFRVNESVIHEGQSVWMIKDVPYDDYAIQSYHDKNDNDVMDQFFMIPQEAWGFSNNVRHTFSPPSWEEVKFRVDQPAVEIIIQVK